MAHRIFYLAFLSALASQAALQRNARAESVEQGPFSVPLGPDGDESQWGTEGYDPYVDEQADIFGDFTMAR